MSKNPIPILFILCGLILTGAIFFTNFLDDQELVLIIRDQETKQIYVSKSVEIEGVIETSWIHSVEKTPWHEKWRITESGEFSLIETRFQSFGAGVPHQTEGNVRIVDGYTVMTGDSQILPVYRWIHSQNAQFKLMYNDSTILATEAVPHHSKLEMFIKKR